MMVIKVGGNELDSPAFMEGFAQALALMAERPVVVHGGGRGTTELMARLGLEAQFINGLRVTDEQTLDLAVMGMVGQASTQIVNALVQVGIPAVGLSGVDANLITAERFMLAEGDLGAVGLPIAVNTVALRGILEAGFLPCIAPICRSITGDLLNVNADQVAQIVAIALETTQLLFLTNVPAVRIRETDIAFMTPAEIEQAISDGAISGGMIPKTRAAAIAVNAGVQSVVITNLEGLVAIARGDAAGTTIQQA